MKILLVDVDSKIPNLALMKLSGYYKSKGYTIEFKKLKYNGYPSGNKDKSIIDGEGYDQIFISIIFTVNKEVLDIVGIPLDKVSIGGTGYDYSIKLPQEIDDFKEDYSIYPENKISYGFITRGCIRNCYFCFVPKKEGKLYQYRGWKEVVKPQFKKTRFLDNNFLAWEHCEKVMQELIDDNVCCSFNEGLDFRELTDNKAKLLSKLNYYPSEYVFAFDNINYLPLIIKKHALLKKYFPKDWKIKFYCYVNAEMPIQDTVKRIKWCKQNKVLPYLMRDKNCWASKNKEFYNNLAAYCNQPAIFKKMDFNKDFIEKRTKNIDTQNKCKQLWR